MYKTIKAILLILCMLCLVPGMAMARQGGSNNDGYSFIDSEELDGPTYSMIDISGTGNLAVACDDCYGGPVNLGFSMEFFGTDYNSMYISSNGFVSFGSGSSSLSNQVIPDPNTPNNLIAVCWDDIDVGNYGGQGAFYQYFADCPHPDFDGPCMVVMWNNANHFPMVGEFDLELILFPNGDFLMQFGPGNPELGSGSTTGVENSNGQCGVRYAANQAGSLQDNLAIYFEYRGPSICDTGEEEEELDWDEQYKIVYGDYDYYDKLPSQEVYEEGDDTFLGIKWPPCFMTAAAGQSGMLFPLILAAITTGGILIRKRFSR